MAEAGPDKEGVHNLFAKPNFYEALSQPGLMIVEAFATWCGPCKTIARTLVQLSEKYPTARFYKIDVDEVPDVASELNIRAMPTFVIFKDGEIFETVVGANVGSLEEAIKKGLA